MADKHWKNIPWFKNRNQEPFLEFDKVSKEWFVQWTGDDGEQRAIALRYVQELQEQADKN